MESWVNAAFLSAKSVPKLRLFAIDRRTGRPLIGVRLEAWATLRADAAESDPAGQSDPGRADSAPGCLGAAAQQVTEKEAAAPARRITRLHLGILQTDHVGYVAFALPQAFLEAVFVGVVGSAEAPQEIPDFGFSQGARAIELDGDLAPSLPPALPAAQRPDPADWVISPNSFGTNRVELVGQDGCEELLISTAPTHVYGFTQVRLTPDSQEQALEPFSCAPNNAGSGQTSELLVVRRAALIEYETSFIPAGHGLGEVLYSLPLAPCESVKIATVEWSRADRAERTEATGITESLAHEQRRDRGIAEIVQGTLSEWQRGGTVMGAVAGAYSAGAGSISGSLGASYSTSAGDRQATADTLQRLADTIVQASTNVRQLYSTVVVQASQQESERLQTRTVTNHNHCHALTVLYYEIVRHFRVRTAVSSFRDVLLIRHPEQGFDAARALRERRLLGPALLDRGLAPGFDALAAASGGGDFGAVRALIVKVTTGDVSSTAINPPLDRHSLMLTLSSGRIRHWMLATHMTEVQRAVDNDFPFRARQTNTFLIPVDGIQLRDCREIGVHYRSGGADDPGHLFPEWALKGLEVLAAVQVGSGSDTELIRIYSRPDINKHFVDDGEWWDGVTLPPVDAAAHAREVSAEALLAHLNDHRSYYDRVLWLAEDPGRRASWLAGYDFEHDGVSGRLIDFVENRIVDVIGDQIVLPTVGTDAVRTIVTGLAPPEERMIGLPTRGAFAEAKLANCNACEVIDDTRFWDWSQSPCPETAPGIADLMAGSRARDAGVAPSGLPAANLGVEGAAPAPDPTGMTAVLDLLGRSDAFRDMSGRPELAGVMNSLVNGAVQLQLEQIRQQSAQALERIRQQNQAGQQTGTGGTGAPASSSGTGGGTSTAVPAGSAAPASPVRARQQAYQQAANTVQSAVRTGALSDEEAQQAQRQLTESMVRETIADPTATRSASQAPPATSPTPAPSRGPGAPGTETNPWIIDNFLIDQSALPSATTRDEAVVPLLDQIAREVAAHRGDILHVTGYADRSGTERHNRNLAVERALAIADELRDRGAAGGPRLMTEGMGETHSRGFADDDGAQHNRHDRRVEIWRGSAGAAVLPALACDVRYSVPLVAQPTKTTGWAACVAMLVSYRRHVSLSPEEVCRRLGVDPRSAIADFDLLASDIQRVFRLDAIPPAAVTREIGSSAGWCNWLTRHGPLCLMAAGSPSHAAVITGLIGGENPEVYVNDPWDRTATNFGPDPIAFNADNFGWRGRVLFSAFINDFYGVDLDAGTSSVRIFYIS